MLSFGVAGAGLPPDGSAWRDAARRFEAAGFTTLWMADHVGLPDPFAPLVAAATVTERLRVGTYVLNVGLWNPLLLARTAATVDGLSGGRLVLGLGAGHNAAEFVQAGLRYPPAGERVSRLEAVVEVLPRLLAGETVDDDRLGLAGAATGLPPARPPLLVGGNGDRVLDLAGRRADAVGLVGFTSGTTAVHTDLSHWGWDGLVDRLGRARAAASGRPLAADVLVQRVAVTDDPRAAVADLLERGLADDLLDSPFLLVGTEDELVARLRQLEDAGVDGVTVLGGQVEAFVPVMTRYRAERG